MAAPKAPTVSDMRLVLQFFAFPPKDVRQANGVCTRFMSNYIFWDHSVTFTRGSEQWPACFDFMWKDQDPNRYPRHMQRIRYFNILMAWTNNPWSAFWLMMARWGVYFDQDAYKSLIDKATEEYEATLYKEGRPIRTPKCLMIAVCKSACGSCAGMWTGGTRDAGPVEYILHHTHKEQDWYTSWKPQYTGPLAPDSSSAVASSSQDNAPRSQQSHPPHNEANVVVTSDDFDAVHAFEELIEEEGKQHPSPPHLEDDQCKDRATCLGLQPMDDIDDATLVEWAQQQGGSW